MYSSYTKEQVKQFVSRFGDIIVKAITDQGLFFPAVVGQLTMESRWGTSDLSAKYNNYGGIKNTGSEFSTGSVSLDTTEVVKGREIPMEQNFATYGDFTSFMADYVRVLHLSQYINAGVFTATTPFEQVLAMGKGGYSTQDPAKYLTLAKGRIEACIDLYPWGKINSNIPAPELAPASTIGLSTIAASINASIAGLFDKSMPNPSKLQPVL